jgi:hypothetical protein
MFWWKNYTTVKRLPCQIPPCQWIVVLTGNDKVLILTIQKFWLLKDKTPRSQGQSIIYQSKSIIKWLMLIIQKLRQNTFLKCKTNIIALRKTFVDRSESYDSKSAQTCAVSAHETVWVVLYSFFHFLFSHLNRKRPSSCSTSCDSGFAVGPSTFYKQEALSIYSIADSQGAIQKDHL